MASQQCPMCRKRIKDTDLLADWGCSDEGELYSDLMHRCYEVLKARLNL